MLLVLIQYYSMIDWSIFSANMLTHWRKQLIPHLHFYDGPGQRTHGGLEVQVTAIMVNTWPTGLLPHKALLVLLIIHFFIKCLIAFLPFWVDAHCKPILIQVVVPGYREHDGHGLNVVIFLSLIEVVGHDPHAAGGLGGRLAEGAYFGFLGAHGGLRWVGDFTVLQIDSERFILY